MLISEAVRLMERGFLHFNVLGRPGGVLLKGRF